MRTVGPPGAHLVAVRIGAQSKGIAKLSKPPHDAPMPNRVSSFEKCVDRGLRDRLEHDAEQSARAREIAPPEGVAGTAFERGMEHAGDFGPLCEPARHFQSRLMVLRQPHAHGAQPAQAEIDVIGADAEAERVHRIGEPLPGRLVCRNGAEHHVGMAADIFGGGLDRKVDPLLEGTKIERGRPGIVHQHHRALGVGGGRDGRHVLDFERERARRFHEHGAGVGLDQRGDAAADQRIVIGRGDAVALEHAIAELPRGLVDAVGHQQMIAGLEHRKQRGRNRREPGRQKRNAGAIGPFERAQRVFKRLRSRRAAAPVKIAGAAREEILGGRIEHRRDVMDRRIDETMIGGRVAAAHHEPGCRFKGGMRGVRVGRLGHGIVLSVGLSSRAREVGAAANAATFGLDLMPRKRQPLDRRARSF